MLTLNSKSPFSFDAGIFFCYTAPARARCARNSTFLKVAEEITNVFLSRGVFHQGSGLAASLGH
jgi:hypothetical protein